LRKKKNLGTRNRRLSGSLLIVRGGVPPTQKKTLRRDPVFFWEYSRKVIKKKLKEEKKGREKGKPSL